MNWIKNRLECSIEHVFLALKARIAADAREWMKATGELVRLTEESERLIVSRTAGDAITGTLRSWCRVEREQYNFEVIFGKGSNETHRLRFVPRLNAAGECRLFLDDQELEYWQASMKVLEPVLFG